MVTEVVQIDILANTKQATKSVNSFSKKFQGWALSVLFLSQQIQRSFQRMTTSSMKMFQDVAHSANGLVTNIDRLNGEWQYLKFTIGEAINTALAPLLPLITDVVTKLADWISRNPKLTATLLALGIVISYLVNIGAQLVLLFNGLAMAGFIGTASAGIPVLTKFGNLIEKLALGLFPALGLEIARTRLALAGMSAMSKLGLAGMVTGIILAIAWLIKFTEQVGGIGGTLKAVASGLIRVFAFIGDLLTRAILIPFQTLIGLIARLMDLVGMSTPEWMEDFVKFRTNMSKNFLEYQQETGFLSPDTGFIQPRSIGEILRADLGVEPQVTNNNVTINAYGLNEQELATEIARIQTQ